MQVVFRDLQNSNNPFNGVTVESRGKLLEILTAMRRREPFGLELVAENGFTLGILLANAFGAVEHKPTNGSPPRMEAVAPSEPSFSEYGNPYAEAVRRDEENSIEPPTFLVGDTPTPVPTHYVLPYEMVEKVAVYFLETGERQADVLWEQI